MQIALEVIFWVVAVLQIFFQTSPGYMPVIMVKMHSFMKECLNYK